MGKLNSKGFGVVEGLLIFVVVIIIGGTGYYVYHAQQSSNKNLADNSSSPSFKKKATPTTKPSTTDPYSGWSTYNSAYENVSFQYPKNWSLASTSSGEANDVTLTSPNGYKLTYYDFDGLASGGSCGSSNVSLTAVESVTIPNSPNSQTYIVESGNEVALYMADGLNPKPAVGDTGGCLYGPSLASVKYPDTASEPGLRIGFTSNKYFTAGSPKPVPSGQASDFATAKLILASFKYGN